MPRYRRKAFLIARVTLMVALKTGLRPVASPTSYRSTHSFIQFATRLRFYFRARRAWILIPGSHHESKYRKPIGSTRISPLSPMPRPTR